MITFTRRSTRARYAQRGRWRARDRTAELEARALARYPLASPDYGQTYGFLLPNGQMIDSGYSMQHPEAALEMGSELYELQAAGFDRLVVSDKRAWVEAIRPLTVAQQRTLRDLLASKYRETIAIEAAFYPEGHYFQDDQRVLHSGEAHNPIELRQLIAATNAALA